MFVGGSVEHMKIIGLFHSSLFYCPINIVGSLLAAIWDTNLWVEFFMDFQAHKLGYDENPNLDISTSLLQRHGTT